MASCFNDVELCIQNAQLDDALAILEAELDGLLQTFRDRLTVFRTHLNLLNNTPMTPDQNIVARMNLGTDILSFAREFCESQDENIQVINEFGSLLVVDNSYPFADRATFRDMLQSALDAPNAQILLVNGTSKSGMSHLEKYLQHLASKMDLLSFYPFSIPHILDEPDGNLGELLAYYMTIPLSLQVDFTNLPGDQFKFAQFITKLKEKIRESDTVPIFFLHDFHKVQKNHPTLLAFIDMLIKEICMDFPKAVFILAGLKYELLPKWIEDFEAILKDNIYTMENVSVDDIKACLHSIFSEYKEKIKAINDQGEELLPDQEPGEAEEVDWDAYRQQYIEDTLEHLLKGQNTVNLKEVGDAIKKHLLLIKN